MRHKLHAFDGDSSLLVDINTGAEFITIQPLSDEREILIETTGGELRVRCYDGRNDSPFTVIIPRADVGIATDSEDYERFKA